MIKQLRYSLSNLVRRIRRVMEYKWKRFRDGLAHAFGVLLALMVAVPASAVSWSVPWWALAIGILASWMIIGLFMWAALNGMKEMDKREAKVRKQENNDRDTYLINAINRAAKERDQKLIDMTKAISQTLEATLEKQRSMNSRTTQAIVAASQENSRTIIKAMREPLDGHE